MDNNQAQTYLASGGDHCPYCKGKDIDDVRVDKTGTHTIAVVIYCLDCKKQFTDHYTLTGVNEFKKEG